MTYSETVEYLFNATPMFQQIGAAAYKPGLDTALALDSAFSSSHKAYKTIHVAGTNGKGSTCHTLAAILQAQGYKVGLFTSPHLIDFRERIRVDGKKISEDAVVGFVERYKNMSLGLSPSFFELTTIMAFDYFARCGVDIAVIETGLGGRLDTTNIISPIVTAITNISFDHKAQLGNSLVSIAKEKAGIIKEGIPVVIGNDKDVRQVFVDKAGAESAPIVFAQEKKLFDEAVIYEDRIEYKESMVGDFKGKLTGDCQPENTATVLCIVQELRALGIEISDMAVKKGFDQVVESTGLLGRWMILRRNPTVICDTGHNEGGWKYLSRRLSGIENLRMVIGFVSDKEVEAILKMMPRHAAYYFAQASVKRAMDSFTLAEKAARIGLKGNAYPTLADAYYAAIKEASQTDTIFVGGSTFIVADLLSSFSDF